MHAVAVTRWGAPLEQELAILAGLMGMAPYDARLKLLAPLPVLVASFAQAEGAAAAAQALRDKLRSRGHGAVAIDRKTLPSGDRVLVPRGFELQADCFVAIDALGGRYPVPCAEIIGLFRATEVVSETAVSETVHKKFSLQRAALTGGLIRHQKVVKSERSSTSDREQVLYLFHARAPDPLRLHEGALNYAGLGDARSATRLQNFGALVQWLRSRASAALYDERMLTQKRRASGLAVQQTKTDHVVQTDNQSDNDLAAYLLLHAHQQGQL